MAKVLTSSRKQWLDALRALAMLMVIYGHFYRSNNDYFYWTGPVKIPLFFVISGYLLDQKDDDLKTFFLRVLKSLVIPWLALSILPELVYLPVKGIGYFLTSLGKILIGEKVWYMPCCILAEILFVLLKKLTRKNWLLAVVSVCLTVIGYIAAQYGRVIELFSTSLASLVFVVTAAMVSQSFLLLGMGLSRQEQKLQKLKIWVPLACIGVYICLVAIGVLLMPGKAMDVHQSRYYNAVLCAAQILLGNFALFVLAPKIKRYPKLLTFVGQNTLVFYIFHTWGGMAVKVALQLVGISLPNTWYAGLAMTVVVCIGCGIGAVLFNRLLPELVGKKRMKKVCA